MDFSQILANLEKAFTIVAIIVAGLWAYFNYFKGRIYRPKLKPEITGIAVPEGDQHHLLITANLTNIGISKVDLQQRGTALRIYSCHKLDGINKVKSAEWIRVATYSVFENHGWIEAGETIEEQRLVSLPIKQEIAFQFALRVVSKKIEWNATSIVRPMKV
jgi:hypothetical protein